MKEGICGLVVVIVGGGEGVAAEVLHFGCHPAFAGFPARGVFGEVLVNFLGVRDFD